MVRSSGLRQGPNDTDFLTKIVWWLLNRREFESGRLYKKRRLATLRLEVISACASRLPVAGTSGCMNTLLKGSDDGV
jgi:hypothetical protein